MRLTLWMLPLIALVIQGCGADELQPGTTTRPIINGTPIGNEATYGMAHVVAGGGACSGTMLTNRWVLTARHCFQWVHVNNPNLVEVQLGAQQEQADLVIRHPNTDVALVRLAGPLKVAGKLSGYTRAIFAGEPEELLGKTLGCAGYGRDTILGGGGTLRAADLDVTSVAIDGLSFRTSPNGSDQIQWKRDSGSSCYLGTLAAGQITGVQSTCNITCTPGLSCWDANGNLVSANILSVDSCTLIAAAVFRQWARDQMTLDSYGRAVASGDFNGDGLLDVAVGEAGAAVNGTPQVGAVHVYLQGGASLDIKQMLTQDKLDVDETGDRFGAALAAGDFNGDGIDDLAVGAPREGLKGTGVNAGRVYVFLGTRDKGLQPSQSLSQEPLDTSYQGDRFGAALASGDFDGDRLADLAVGAPNNLTDGVHSGAVFLFRGGAGGLNAWHFIDQTGRDENEAGDLFGHALAAGDVTGTYDDLVVGAPGECPGAYPCSGAAYVLSGWKGGLAMLAELDQTFMDTNDTADLFGWSVAVGELSGDGYGEVVVGAPGERNKTRSGAVYLYKGNAVPAVWHALTQSGMSAEESGDWFGAGLATGDLDGDGDGDLAVGAPGEAPGSTAPESGIVLLFKGDSAAIKPWKELGQGGLAKGAAGDRFGTTLVSRGRARLDVTDKLAKKTDVTSQPAKQAGDASPSVKEDKLTKQPAGLMISAPGKRSQATPAPGAVFEYEGSPFGPQPVSMLLPL